MEILGKTPYFASHPTEDNIPSYLPCRRREYSHPVENVELRHDIRRVPAARDWNTESDLQARLSTGAKIWIVGDIHGHLATFRALIHRLKLRDEDRVVLLGDMIDRGPNSAGVIEYVKNHPQIIAIKGNHEQMAVRSLQGRAIELDPTWLAKGGSSTWGSYIVAAKGDLHQAKLTFAEDCAWMADLPSHIVLDKWRLVHAGYHPEKDLDTQDEKNLLWIRGAFFRHDKPIDEQRTVIFGHTPTKKFGKCGSIANSKIILDDGRPSWKALDVSAFNHRAPGIVAFDLQKEVVVKQKTLKSEYWWTKTKAKEAPISEFYGLVELRRRSRYYEITEKKSSRKLHVAGATHQIKSPVSFRIVPMKDKGIKTDLPLSGNKYTKSVKKYA